MRSSGSAAGRGVGLDIGHASVTLVELQGARLLRWTAVPVSAGAVVSGVVRDGAAVADSVRRAVAAAGTGGQSVVSGVSGAACFIRRLQFPDLAPKDLQRAVRWEAERLLPYPFEQAAVDYDVLARRNEQGKTVVEVVLVGARAEVVDGYRAAIEAGGAKVAVLDATPLARLRAYRRDVTPPGVLLVHLGRQWAELTAADEYGLVFTRTVSMGSPFDFAQGERASAEELSPRPVRGASGARTLLEEVVRSVRFFETQAGTQIARILLTGSGAEDPATVTEFTAADLPPAVVVDPLAALQRDPSVPAPPTLRLGAAVGFALRAAQIPEPREAPWR